MPVTKFLLPKNSPAPELLPEKLLNCLITAGSPGGQFIKSEERQLGEEKKVERPKLTNEISDETGQYDMRFLLWRQFCAAHNIPVETLPGDLTGETRKKWEALKESRLKKQ